MPKRIDHLTDAQRAMFDPWIKKWIDIGLRTGETDWETFDQYMPICYAKAGLKYPSRVIRVSSPLVGALAASVANALLNNGAVHGAVGDAVHGAVGDAVHGAVGDAVHDAIDDAVGDAVRGAVGDAVHGAVGDAVHGAIDDAVHGAVGGAMQTLQWNYWLGGQFWVGGWYGSPAVISFFTDACGLILNKDITERAMAYRMICESVNYIWPNHDFVMVCARPTLIRRDENGRLHSETGHAIEYPDGWGLSSWHGTVIPDAWIANRESITPQQALTWTNLEQRRAACEIIGWNRVLSELNARVIDQDENPEIGTLLEANIPDSGKERFLRVRCATGRQFVLPVPKEIMTARQGNAWTYGIDPSLFNVEVRT